MSRAAALIVILIATLGGPAAFAGERIAGVNSYVLNEERWDYRSGVYWRQDNSGVFEVTEGPIDPGFVRCIGAGFGDATGVSGGGICIFGSGADSFTWSWKANPGALNTWKVIDGTGKYEGMTGEGTAKSRIASEFHALQHRQTDWEGEVTLRK